jgi:hypothetical protein
VVGGQVELDNLCHRTFSEKMAGTGYLPQLSVGAYVSGRGAEGTKVMKRT